MADVSKTIVNTGPPPSIPPRPSPIPPPAQPPKPNPNPIPSIPPGKGNLLYVCTTNTQFGQTNRGGVAKCVMAYGTDGTDGAPVWSAVNTGLTTAAEKNCYKMNFDPWSYNGTSFTRMWLVNEAGLYLGTGLPNAVTWAAKLTDADASTLLGKTVVLGESFTPSVRLANWIGIIAYESVATHDGLGAHYHAYTLWSTDLGATWNGNSAYYLCTYATITGAGRNDTLRLVGSYTHDNVWYITGDLLGNQAGVFPTSGIGYPGFVVRATTMPQFGNVYQNVPAIDTHGAWAVLCQPFYNQSGVPRTSDDVMYVWGISFATGTQILVRYNHFETLEAYPAADVAYVGDAQMTWGHSSPRPPFYFFTNALDESYLIGGGFHDPVAGIPNGNPIWTSTDRAVTWVARPNEAGAMIGASPASLFSCLADPLIFFTAAMRSAGTAGYAFIAMTIDFGTTMINIGKPGAADGIDAALGLTQPQDAQYSVLMLDYYKV